MQYLQTIKAWQLLWQPDMAWVALHGTRTEHSALRRAAGRRSSADRGAPCTHCLPYPPIPLTAFLTDHQAHRGAPGAPKEDAGSREV